METCRKKMTNMKQKKKAIEKECLAEEAQLAKLQKQADDMEAANQEEDDNLVKMEEELEDSQKKLLELTGELAGVEKTAEEGRHVKNQLEAAATKAGSKSGRLASELEVMNARVADIKTQLEALVAECVVYEEQLDEYDEKYEEHEEKVKVLELESTSICNIVKSSENAEADTQRRCGEGVSEIDRLSLKYEDMEREAAAHEEKNGELEQQLEQVEEELTAIKEKHAETVLHIQSCVNEINDM